MKHLVLGTASSLGTILLLDGETFQEMSNISLGSGITAICAVKHKPLIICGLDNGSLAAVQVTNRKLKKMNV